MTPLEEGSCEPERGGARCCPAEKADRDTVENRQGQNSPPLMLSASAKLHHRNKRRRRHRAGAKDEMLSLVSVSVCQESDGAHEPCKKQRHKRQRRGANRYLTTVCPVDIATSPVVAPALLPVAAASLPYDLTTPMELAPCSQAKAVEKSRCEEETLSVVTGLNAGFVCRRPSSHLREEFYAALDLGTNNCRLLIAQPLPSGHFRVVDGFSRLVRLGEGISCSNRLKVEAMERTIEALKICRDKLSRWNICQQRLIATEACRATVNGAEFVARVRREAGLELEVVDRETEARLAVAGCASLVERGTRGAILFDIGGGSSEIALLDMSKHHSPRLSEHITAWTSLPVGVVTLAERFGTERVSYQDFRRMKAYVSELLYQFAERDRLGALVRCPSFHLIGTSGTVTTLAGVHLNLKSYDRRRVDGMWLHGYEVSRICQRLLSWDIRQRAANPCIGAERADLVLAGCAILEAIRTVWPSRRLRVADRGLREGILTELMANGEARRHEDAS